MDEAEFREKLKLFRKVRGPDAVLEGAFDSEVKVVEPKLQSDRKVEKETKRGMSGTRKEVEEKKWRGGDFWALIRFAAERSGVDGKEMEKELAEVVMRSVGTATVEDLEDVAELIFAST